jgi:hypothetical protein
VRPANRRAHPALAVKPTIHRQAVPYGLVTDALQTIWNDLLRRGLLPDEVDGYRRSHDWFPWLKPSDAIETLRLHVDRELDPIGASCEPQIMVQFPDNFDGKLLPHIDRRDPMRMPYRTIAGVALTEQHERNGGLHWWNGEGLRTVLEPLAPGDVVELPGQVPHASGGNHTGMPRVAVYLRWA